MGKDVRLLMLLKTIVFLLFSTTIWAADPPLTLYDEGAKQGVVFKVDCVGAGISCSKSGIVGTLNVSGGGGGGGSSVWTLGAGNVGISTTNNVGIGTSIGSAALTIMGGNVGIGTWKPVDRFQVNSLSDKTGSFHISNVGNVGINTSTTTSQLTVNGDIKVTSIRGSFNLGNTLVFRTVNDGYLIGSDNLGGASPRTSILIGTGIFINGPGTDNDNVIIGHSVSFTSSSGNANYNTLIGARSTGDLSGTSELVGLGYNQRWGLNNNYTMLLGAGAKADTGGGDNDYSICIGYKCTITGQNAMFMGNNDTNNTGAIFEYYFGGAISNANPSSPYLSPQHASGTNIAGAVMHLRGGAGTGSGTPGEIKFLTGAVLGSGTTTQSHVERMRISGNGNVGIGTTLTNELVTIGGNILLDRTTSAIIMKEPDGTCGSCTLSNSEVFTCVSVACP